MGHFRMPSLGADMEQGTLVEWKVAEGDTVHRGDIVAAVDTDKATIDVEIFEDGVVTELLAQPGDVLPVGAPLAVIGDAAVPPPAPAVPAVPAVPAAEEPAVPPPAPVVAAVEEPGQVHSPVLRHLADRLGVDVDAVEGSGPGGRVTRTDIEHAGIDVGATRPADGRPDRVRASPRARRSAARSGVELTAVLPTAPDGALRERDVLAVAARPVAARPVAARPVPSEAAPADRSATMRRAIARTMARSNREIPHYHLATTVDLGATMSWLREHNEGRAPAQRLLPAALVLRAVALAVLRTPQLNGAWVDDGFRPATGVHLGVAVSLRGGGLVAPVLRDADRSNPQELMATLADLVTRARRGGLRASEMDGAGLTVTNLGDRGVEVVHGVIHPPQVALVGVGRIQERALVVDGAVVARPSAILSLAADHRASDGQVGSRLLNDIDALLQRPEDL
jgi:pyruvate dehydrogenase E2 component (dihydrolipoamide acetyltransferase)